MASDHLDPPVNSNQSNQSNHSDQFYARLPLLRNLIEITQSERFVPVPEDWLIAITDVKESTAAIQAGRYKEINLLGACSIVSVLNAIGDIEIPYIFGGDGATLLIPPSCLAATQQALLGTKHLARQAFGLELRVGIVPVATIQVDYPIQIAKLAIAPHYAQAVIKGGGLLAATHLIKSKSEYLYEIEEGSEPVADFSGLECRWQDIPSRHGEMISLMVMATAEDPCEADATYADVIQQLEKIYGGEHNLHPLSESTLRLSFQDQQLLYESKVFQPTLQGYQRWLHILKLKAINFLGWFLMRFQITTAGFDWGTYKQLVIQATDYRKFDDVLRMVISSSPEQRSRLQAMLEQEFQKGRLVYGLHCSDRALMTCLVFERSGRQVHFIDGADGGYTLSAQKLKSRLQGLSSPL